MAGAEAPLRVVIVDNDLDALDLVDIDLSLEGHDVVGRARQGGEAIRLCQRLLPDVLVVDVKMPPGPDGIAVTRALHDQDGLRIVVYSNYRDAHLREAAQALGATFLPKGQLAALRAAVRGGAL